MATHDPTFWELSFDPGDFDALPADLFGAAGTEETDPARAALRAEALAGIAELVVTSLTDKQRLIVERYFYDGRTQQEIAAELGIAQQVVSRQLFGVIRDGKRIGGAVQRLRKLCEARGWDPSGWV
jgi:DNA-directed RNA polymerase specialized sigma24 family protein